MHESGSWIVASVQLTLEEAPWPQADGPAAHVDAGASPADTVLVLVPVAMSLWDKWLGSWYNLPSILAEAARSGAGMGRLVDVDTDSMVTLADTRCGYYKPASALAHNCLSLLRCLLYVRYARCARVLLGGASLRRVPPPEDCAAVCRINNGLDHGVVVVRCFTEHRLCTAGAM